jgi:ATP-dependent Zn protease
MEASGGTGNSDLARATQLALRVVASYGLTKSAPLWLGPIEEADIEPLLSRWPEIASQVREMLVSAEAAADQLVRANSVLIQQVARLLLTHETLSSDDVEAVCQSYQKAIAQSPAAAHR